MCGGQVSHGELLDMFAALEDGSRLIVMQPVDGKPMCDASNTD
jgi:hypothetical protein